MLDLDVAAILPASCGAPARHGAVGAHLGARSTALAAGRRRLADRSCATARSRAPVLVDAAGAWADAVGRLAGLRPLGIVAASGARPSSSRRRRTCHSAAGRWSRPSARSWYVKPDAGRLLCSPADETPSPALRRAARGARRRHLRRADRGRHSTFPIRRIESRWAGLRCFAADETPVAGFDPRAPGFFWLAGQGGYGIQTAPALAALAAAAILDEAPRGPVADADIDRAALAPARLYNVGG